MQVTPAILKFKGPHKETATEFITVTNDTDGLLAFKVKTTAPKFYCVRPNAAVLEKGEKMDVLIISQGLPEEPTAPFKCKDKFLIEGVPVSKVVENKEVSENWAKLVQLQGQGGVDSKKIRVAFLVGETYTAKELETRKEKAALLSSKSTGSTPKPSVVSSPIEAPKTSASQQVKNEIEASNAKVAALNEKLDSNESSPVSSGSGSPTAVKPASGSSSFVTFAALTVVLAVLLKYFGYF
ncbi:unnamed protein product [Kuraishia capsulata CBS 1993]|uniref:MSP domain-containing protein n=1 Tax=Kuraishia capsulata CBS 1993 TaxID=1382522 RepID=W6MNI3_9ASCO|nr:uncharacterized protein KUCA_T00003817001 [Kuraishia capsulata CBS 1993]CDK27838.1 unnamed protein product [Kuraishia capsulata CBS 1993]